MSQRICICGAQIPFVKGGAEILVSSLRRELLKCDFKVDLVELPFKWYPRDQILRSVLAWRLLDLTESNGERIDLVIATRFPSYAVKHPNKVVWLVHQFRQVYDLYGTAYSDFSDEPRDRWTRERITSIDNQTLGEARQVFSIARNTSNRLARYNNLEAEVLYHPPKLEGRLHSAGYGDYVFAPSRLDPSKRLDLLIRAMARVKSKAQCIITGTGSDEARLLALTRHLGVEGRVTFTGYVDDDRLVDLYARCFAVYYAPFDEDYGYVTLEAFLAHKPVITASDSGEVLEFVDDGQNGCVSKKGDPKEIAASIDRLYAQPELCREMGERGHEKVMTISWDSVIAKLTATL